MRVRILENTHWKDEADRIEAERRKLEDAKKQLENANKQLEISNKYLENEYNALIVELQKLKES